VALGQTTDGGIPLGIDARRDELAQVPVLADDAERSVVGRDKRARRVDDPLQDDR
jgi:hypothetical protein